MADLFCCNTKSILDTQQPATEGNCQYTLQEYKLLSFVQPGSPALQATRWALSAITRIQSGGWTCACSEFQMIVDS
jgi:ketosteroid isomerase-like protein